MSDHLQNQYDEIVEVILKYYQFDQKVINRLLNPIVLFKHRKTNKDLYSADLRYYFRKPKKHRELFKSLAQSEDQENPFYEISVSEYPQEALKKYIQTRHPKVDFKAIAKLHQLKHEKSSLSLSTSKVFFGAAYTLGTILFKSVPKSVVESWGVKYTDFEIGVFYFTLGLIIYVLLISIPFLYQYLTTKGEMAFMKKTLAHFAF